MSAPRHKYLSELVAAFILLTRFPLPWGRVSSMSPDLNASVWAFPVVGAFVGAFGACFYALALLVGIPALTSAFLTIGGMVLMTGALHEDGLADVADGFGGGGTLERKLEIMRDSRVGAYGVIAIIIALGIRTSSLSVLSASQAFSALIIAGMLSRLMMVFAMRYMPPARRDGLAHDAGKPSLGRAMFGLALSVIVTAVLTGLLTSLYVTSVAFGAYLLMSWIAQRQIGGMTGDVLGATQQVTDIAVLLFLVSNWH